MICPRGREDYWPRYWKKKPRQKRRPLNQADKLDSCGKYGTEIGPISLPIFRRSSPFIPLEFSWEILDVMWDLITGFFC
jgi:hypothetical protein